jgi:23S rRNA (cytosine1962-C5)-methyltransferase
VSEELNRPALTIRMKRREARRVVNGHPWVFANEIESVHPGGVDSGLCRLEDDSRRYIGSGYYNKHSLIAVRLLTRDSEEVLDSAFFHERLFRARVCRVECYESHEAFRWVFGESDGLPGLVVEVYPGVIQVQVGTLGMETLRPLWEPPLRELAGNTPLFFRNDGSSRRHEDLPLYVAYPDGLPPECIEWQEAGAPVIAFPRSGPGTGFYLDQRENRLFARRFAAGADVLDLFSYTGAFGLGSLSAGARKVTFVDRSQAALDAAARSATARHGDAACEVVCGDVLDYLKATVQKKRQFDLVIADPSTFISSRKTFASGSRAYLALFRDVMAATRPGGHAVLCSRSYHLKDSDFEEILEAAAQRSGRVVQFIWKGGAGPDHPRPVSMPEARYLKCAFVRVD